MEKRYGRAQFLRDALSLGLPTHLAFSRKALRRQRDSLIREHHPDRGGRNDKAQEINEIYGRMIRWLDQRYRPGLRQSEAVREEPQTEVAAEQAGFLAKAASAIVWAGALIASTYVVAKKSRRL